MYDNYKELLVDLMLTAKERPLTPKEQALKERAERVVLKK